MNFLQLVNRTIQECAVSGGPISSVEDQTGEFLRIVDWVNQSWLELQLERPNWDWMRSSQLLGGGVSFATVAGEPEYTLGTGSGTVGVEADDFASWVPRSFRDQTTSSGVQDQIPLAWISFEAWRNSYSMGAQQSVQTRPVAIAVGPNNSICVGPWPTSTYTLTGDYYRAPTQMEVNADVPTGLPAQYHMGIVYQAMISYGEYEEDAYVISRGTRGYRKISRRLGNLRGGMITPGRALA